MKESELSEAEKVCIDLYRICDQKSAAAQRSILDDVREVGKKILKNLEPEIKPVFPSGGYYISNEIGYMKKFASRAEELVGNSFYTQKAATQERRRLQAQTRVREKINIVNEGKNRFVKSTNNHYIFYNHANVKMYKDIECDNQRLASWEYIRTHKAAKTLLDDKEFVKDWKLMKGIKA